jgi:hypothetical protein
MNQRPRIYVLCPAATVTGGPEALHQFAGLLRAKGVDAAMVYYPSAPIANPVPIPYQKYNVAVAHTIEDGAATVIVIPEVVTDVASMFPLSRKAVWWLSVDNYFESRRFSPDQSVFIPRPDLVHLCQSHYAYDYLMRRQVKPLLMLSDFLTEDVFSPGEVTRRPPVAAYNPRKPSQSLLRIMAQTNDRTWLPLQNMDKGQISQVLRAVRLYVDFGPHPGRDRIPREAALCGAVVVTGRRGSAGFAQDMPLPEQFRLDEQMADFETRAVTLINGLLGSETAFQEASAEQEPYRDWVRANKKAFQTEVDAFIAAMHL